MNCGGRRKNFISLRFACTQREVQIYKLRRNIYGMQMRFFFVIFFTITIMCKYIHYFFVLHNLWYEWQLSLQWVNCIIIMIIFIWKFNPLNCWYDLLKITIDLLWFTIPTVGCRYLKTGGGKWKLLINHHKSADFFTFFFYVISFHCKSGSWHNSCLYILFRRWNHKF